MQYAIKTHTKTNTRMGKYNSRYTNIRKLPLSCVSVNSENFFRFDQLAKKSLKHRVEIIHWLIANKFF